MAIEISADIILNFKNGLAEALKELQTYADSNKIKISTEFDKNALNKITTLFKQNQGNLDKMFNSDHARKEISELLGTVEKLQSKIGKTQKNGLGTTVDVKSIENELIKAQTKLAKIGLNFTKDNMNRLVAPVEMEPVLSKNFKEKGEAELKRVKITKEVELVTSPSKKIEKQLNEAIAKAGGKTQTKTYTLANNQNLRSNNQSTKVSKVAVSTIKQLGTTSELKSVDDITQAVGRLKSELQSKTAQIVAEENQMRDSANKEIKSIRAIESEVNKLKQSLTDVGALKVPTIKTEQNSQRKRALDKANVMTEDDFTAKQSSIISNVNKKLSADGYSVLNNSTIVSFENGLAKVTAKIKDAEGVWKSFSAKVDADSTLFSPKFKTITKNVENLEHQLNNTGNTIKKLSTSEMKKIERQVADGLSSNLINPRISVDDKGIIKITADIKNVSGQVKTLTEIYNDATVAVKNFNKASSTAAQSSKWTSRTTQSKSDVIKPTEKSSSATTAKDNSTVLLQNRISKIENSISARGINNGYTQNVTERLTTLKKQLEDLGESKESIKGISDNFNKLEKEVKDVENILDYVDRNLNKFRADPKMSTVFPTEFTNKMTALESLYKTFNPANDSISNFRKNAEKLIKELRGLQIQSNKNIVGKKTYAKDDWMSAARSNASEVGEIMGVPVPSQTANGTEKLTVRVKALNGEVKRLTYTWDSNTGALSRQTASLGKADSIFSTISTKWKQLMAYWTTMYMNPYTAVSKITQVVRVIQGLDDALVDLRKTAKMSNTELNQFYLDANNTAKQMGVSTKGIIEQAAAWSRLGYNTAEQATKMAELSSQFAIISPGMDLEKSQTGLVSTMKAFNVDVNDVKDDIMSTINVVGNNFATSNEQIIDGLERSASAMAASGATLKETIGIFTGAQEIIQNSESVGSAMKSFSMRIRGMDEEGDYDEDLSNITGDVNRLTNGKVRIMKDANTYRGIYDILKDIAGVWDEITDKNRAELLEKLFAKTRANTGAAILSNFDTVENSIKLMEDSVGSADNELAVAQESISYSLNKLKEEWVGVGQNTITRDFLKDCVEVLTSISKILGGIIKVAGPFGTAGGIFGMILGAKNKGRAKSCLSLNMPLAA